jgi:two-component system response regulator FixJ
MTNVTTVPPTIFVVDDEAGVRAALQRLFCAAGLSVETFSSARQLLETCDLARPGLLLLDVVMPEMSGIELHAILLEQHVDLPVIFLTGAATVAMAVDAMRRGAVDFLEKPFDNPVLVERVRHALRHAAGKPVIGIPRIEYERRWDLLTPRERQVMAHVLGGKTNKAMARLLGASHRTIEIHRRRVMDKMRVTSLVDLVGMALTHGTRQ